MKTISIGSDHAGFELKEKIREWLEGKGYKVRDFGCFSEESCDYAGYAKKVAFDVLKAKGRIGILVCGTGIGMCITANKVKGIHAALIHNEFTARSAKEHNNANIICLGARVIGFEKAKKCIEEFLNANFLKGRHLRRVKQVEGN